MNFSSFKKSVSLAFIFSVLLQASCQGEVLSGKAVRISDGDTFLLLVGNRKQIRIRLYGIDAPERGQDFGNVSKEYLGKLLRDKTVTVAVNGKDQYGRVIGIVTTGGVNVNEEMLKAGLAWHFTRYDHNPKWSALESQSRKQKRGLWIHHNPMPPWEFRDLKKKRQL